VPGALYYRKGAPMVYRRRRGLQFLELPDDLVQHVVGAMLPIEYGAFAQACTTCRAAAAAMLRVVLEAQTEQRRRVLLFKACAHGHVNIVQHLSGYHAIVARRGAQGNTEILPGTEIAVDTTDQATRGIMTTPLCVACHRGHAEIVSLLIAVGASINQAMQDGATPLFIACQQSHAEIVQMLIAAGASINQSKQDGVTPLFIACQNKHAHIVALLISAGANID